jgi:hypothetical protein
MENEGWVKLHRKLLKWEWRDDANTGWLFMCCLMSTNHQDNKWHGILVKKGSFITSQKKLSSLTGLTIRQVRVSLTKLKMTGELTVQANNVYSIITIQNWNRYQQDDRPLDRPMTDQRQTDDRPMTTNNNDNNEKNDKNEENILPPKNFLNRLTLTKSQLNAFAKEFQGLSTTEIKEQQEKCNAYMNMSSDNYNNPGLFFRGWLKNYQTDKHEAKIKEEFKSSPADYLPIISEEEKKRNLEKLANIKLKLKEKLTMPKSWKSLDDQKANTLRNEALKRFSSDS